MLPAPPLATLMSLCPNCSTALEQGARFCSSCGTKIGDAPDESFGLIGTILNGKYRVLAELGSGAVGTVYLGEHLSLKKQVALKVLHADLQIGKEALVRFQREGIAAGKFSHPGAIQIFDFDLEGENTWYLAMEYVEGRTLKQYVRDAGPLETEEALDLLEQILSVLAEAHEQGIIHRDLKPENIMVSTSSAGEPIIKVLDFGLSKLLDRGPQASMMTQTGRIMGTPMYMSPEQCAGREVDHRTDIYAAGLVFYEMLCGAPPFQADTLTELLVKQASEEVPSLFDAYPDMSFPVDVDEVLERALEKDPQDRYQSAAEMLEALEEVDLDKLARPAKRRKPARSQTRTQSRTQTSSGRRRRRAARRSTASNTPRIVGIGAVVVLALGALGFVLLREGPRPDLPRLSLHATEDLTEEEQRYVTLLEETRSALRKRDLDEAMGKADDAIAMACSDAEAYLLRGRIFAVRGDLDTAGADYREALKLDPSYALARANLGWVAFESGDRAGAAENFEEAISLDPGSAAALAGDGALQFQDGELRAAEELLRRAVDADSETPRAAEFLGRTLLALEDMDGALEAFVEAKRQDGRSWRAPAGLGQAYLGKGRHEDAERQLREAIDLGPEVWELRRDLATLLVELERYDDANEQIRVGLDRRPNDPGLHVLYGIVLHHAGARRHAIEQLERGIGLGEAGFETRLLCGILLEAEGRSEEALPHLAAAVALRDESVEAHTDYGLALVSLGRYDEAAAELERAIELDDGRAFLRLSLGVLYMNYLGDEARAREQLRRYLELGGDDARVQDWLAQLER